MYLPWTLEIVLQKIPYQFAAAYLVFAVMLFLFSFTKESLEPMPEHE